MPDFNVRLPDRASVVLPDHVTPPGAPEKSSDAATIPAVSILSVEGFGEEPSNAAGSEAVGAWPRLQLAAVLHL